MGEEVGFCGLGASEVGIGGEEGAGEGAGVGCEELADRGEFGVDLELRLVSVSHVEGLFRTLRTLGYSRFFEHLEHLERK